MIEFSPTVCLGTEDVVSSLGWDEVDAVRLAASAVESSSNVGDAGRVHPLCRESARH